MVMDKDIEALQGMLETNSFAADVMSKILSHYQDHPAIIPCTILLKKHMG